MLKFNEHVQAVCLSMTRRTNLQRKVGGADWGWPLHHLRSLRLLEHGLPNGSRGYQRSTRRSYRDITKQGPKLATSKPAEAVCLDSNLPPLKFRQQHQQRIVHLRRAMAWLTTHADTWWRRTGTNFNWAHLNSETKLPLTARPPLEACPVPHVIETDADKTYAAQEQIAKAQNACLDMLKQRFNHVFGLKLLLHYKEGSFSFYCITFQLVWTLR